MPVPPAALGAGAPPSTAWKRRQPTSRAVSRPSQPRSPPQQQAFAPPAVPASQTRAHSRCTVPPPHPAPFHIQIGAFPTSGAAQERIDAAQAAAADLLQGKHPFTMAVSRGNQTIFRARFSGFDEEQAREACKRLTRRGVGCFPLAPHT